jgi:TusA-related sulfurtransferase
MFIPRHPVVENQFCSYGSAAVTTGVGGVVAYAGSVVWLDPEAANQEPIVYKMVYSNPTKVPFGFAMQKVKTGYHQVHPTGFMMPGDLGSSDVIAQPSYDVNGDIDGTKEAPLGVAHMGIWDTVHYTCEMTVANTIAALDNMKPGDVLRAAADEAKVTNNITTAADGNTAATDKSGGKHASDVQVGVVVKGASVAKCQANFNNTTLYPIRIKILV